MSIRTLVIQEMLLYAFTPDQDTVQCNNPPLGASMFERRAGRACGPLALTAVLLIACQSGSPPDETAGQAPTPAPPSAPHAAVAETSEPSTLDGIYTAAQAQRGRQVFENICSECHTTDEWRDEAFLARWDGESVYRFWFYIYEQMPNGEPPYSLPREQVTDVLTYILQLNGLPTGDAELGSDDDSIDQHWLRWRADGSGR